MEPLLPLEARLSTLPLFFSNDISFSSPRSSTFSLSFPSSPRASLETISTSSTSSSRAGPSALPPPVPPKPAVVRAGRARGSVGIPEEPEGWGGTGGRLTAEETAAGPSSTAASHSFSYVASLAAPPLPPRLQRTSSLARSPHPLPSSTAPYSTPFSSTLPTRLLSSSTSALNLKSRLVASAGLRVGREWGKKGADKLTETWKASRSPPSSLPYPTPPLPQGMRLPATILGVRVPRKTGEAFGIELERAVERTRVLDDGLHRRKDSDEVVGDEARKWLPAIALRCLQYLEEWGPKEEGIYRVPGSTTQIAQLRALFDAGMDLELTEIHQADLDPHAVASVFKAWLREIPESLLSCNLEGAIDILLTEAIGYSASATHFLGTRNAAAGTGLVDGRAPRELLEKLRELFGGGMPAEQYHLLRSLSYHLARLSAEQDVNLMSLSNLLLILSPTLKLSPIMLQILVEEREILFSKPNESARLREASLVLDSFVSSPPLSSFSPSRSPPPLSPLPSPSLPSPPSPSLTTSARTPIADLFHTTPPPSALTPSFPTPSALNPSRSPAPPSFPTPYIPSHSPAAPSFFSNRDHVSRRKFDEGVGKKPGKWEASEEGGWSDDERAPAPSCESEERPSSETSSSGREPSSGESQSEQRRSSSEGREPSSVGMEEAPSLEMPEGLGLEEEGGWGLLSVEERRRFFGG